MGANWILGFASALVLACGATGCKRLVYYSAESDNRHAISASDLRAAAQDTAKTHEIGGTPWVVEEDIPTAMRLHHDDPAHRTILALRFKHEGQGRSSFAAEGYSLADSSWWTFGISSASSAHIAEPKIEGFMKALQDRISVASKD